MESKIYKKNLQNLEFRRSIEFEVQQNPQSLKFVEIICAESKTCKKKNLRIQSLELFRNLRKLMYWLSMDQSRKNF